MADPNDVIMYAWVASVAITLGLMVLVHVAWKCWGRYVWRRVVDAIRTWGSGPWIGV